MRQVQAMVAKELWEARWRLAVGTLVMVATAISLPLIFEWAGEMREMMEGLLLPGRWAEAMDAQLASYRLYLWANWWGKNYFQMMTILALVFGMGIIARERSSGALAYIMSRPISRGRVLAIRYAVGAASLAFISVISTLVLVVTSGLVRPEPAPWFLLQGLGQALLAVLVVFGLAVLFSALLQDQVMALVAAGVSAIAVSIPGWIPGYGQYSLFVQMSAPRILSTGLQDPWALAVLALVVAGLYTAALKIFENTDL